MSAVTDPEPAAPSTAKVIKLQKQDKSFKLADVWNEAEDITRSAANRVYGLFSDTSAKPNSAKDEDEKEYKYSGAMRSYSGPTRLGDWNKLDVENEHVYDIIHATLILPHAPWPIPPHAPLCPLRLPHVRASYP